MSSPWIASERLSLPRLCTRSCDIKASFVPHANVLEPILAPYPYHGSHLSIRHGNKRPAALRCWPSFDAHVTKHTGLVFLHANMSHTTPQCSVTQFGPILCPFLEQSEDTRTWHNGPVNRPMFGQDLTRRNSEREFACNLPYRAIVASTANCSRLELSCLSSLGRYPALSSGVPS
jgi:hypothetical protein